MQPSQLFTILLLAVCAIHLLFSSVATLYRWLGKGDRTSATTFQGKKSDRSGWYVFFDPADLYGRTSRQERPDQPRGKEQNGQDRRRLKRTGARLTA